MVSPPELSFRAGQFVSIAVDGPDAPSPSRRSYSIASQSDAGSTLRFIIRVIPSGAASELLMSTPIGGAMRMTGPHGFFVLDQEHAGDVVFGATGTGVAAVMPMLGELCRTVDRGRRYLYWGLRHESDLFAHEEIGDGVAHLPQRGPGKRRMGRLPRAHHAGDPLPAPVPGVADVLPGRQRRDDHRAQT
jgi:ferredoxin-NADP reductase